MHNGFQLNASVKAVNPDDPRGGFIAIASTEVVDRDGEIVDAKAFDPLPASVPVHVHHDFTKPVARGVPRYDGKQLVIEGTFASTPFAQEYRALVAEGIVGHVSVGFKSPQRRDIDGVKHLVKAELLEVSFTSVPANPEAAVLVAKSVELDNRKGLIASLEAQMATVQATIADLKSLTDEVSVPASDGGAEKATATDPEQKAAAQAAADSPAEVPVDKAQAALALLDAFHEGALT